MKLPLPRFQGGFDIVGIQLSNPVMIKRRRETNAVLDKVKDWNITFFCRVTIFISTALHTAAESNLKDPHCHLLRKPPPQDLQHANNTKHLFILH
jgi:ankyrin repeat protein